MNHHHLAGSVRRSQREARSSRGCLLPPRPLLRGGADSWLASVSSSSGGNLHEFPYPLVVLLHLGAIGDVTLLGDLGLLDLIGLDDLAEGFALVGAVAEGSRILGI